jgi:hypothetical protein
MDDNASPMYYITDVDRTPYAFAREALTAFHYSALSAMKFTLSAHIA